MALILVPKPRKVSFPPVREITNNQHWFFTNAGFSVEYIE